MKTVLAFGDSLTWGSDPSSSGRHAPQDRWPSIVEAALPNVSVINEGLRGRTTAYDQTTGACELNGAKTLPMVLHTHAPLDLVVIMLGSNDVYFGKTPAMVTRGLNRLVEIIRHHPYRIEGLKPPEILLVAPPPMVAGSPDPVIAGAVLAASQRLEHAVQYASQDSKVPNVNMRGVAQASPIDGVHLDADNTRKIGEALVQPIRELLRL